MEKFYARKTIASYVLRAPIFTVVSIVAAAMPVPRAPVESTYGCAGGEEGAQRS